MTLSKQNFRGCTILAALLLSACASVTNGPEDEFSLDQRYPIMVEPHMEALRLPYDPARGIGDSGGAELRQFASDFLENGSGQIAISASRQFPDAPNFVADRLAGLGVPRERILVGSSMATNATDGVRVTFIRYQARAIECGDWSVNLGSTAANKASPNFGCATQHNLAAMVADPRDLVTPKPLDPDDAQRRLTVLEKYRNGEATVAEKTGAQSGAVSTVGGGGGGM